MAMSSAGPDELETLQSRLRPLIFGYRAPMLLLAAAELGLADVLADGPLSCDEIAARTATRAAPVYRVLRALASIGVFVELEDGRFALTPLAGLLRADVPGSLRDLVRMTNSRWNLKPWGELAHVLRTGETAFDHVHGRPFFDYLAQHPDASALFDGAMTGRSGPEGPALLESYDFAKAGTVVDVGGGQGAVLASILCAYPHLRGILFDRPEVVAGAPLRLQAAGVADRCQIEGGDFFRAAPAGGDTYLLSRIIHDWDDEPARAILQNCRAAIPSDGTLLIVDFVIPPGNEPHPGKLSDIEMLVNLGGRERTEEEFRTLLAGSDFRLTQVIPTRSGLSAVEARPG